MLGSMTPDFGLEIMDAKLMSRVLKQFQETEKPLEITISIFHRQRSLAQNRWMWGVCVPVVKGWLKETQGENYTKDEVYYYLNGTVLRQKPEIKEILGEEVIVLTGKRFSQMTTTEFSDAVDEIVAYFAERGLEIPMPVPGSNNLLSDYLKDE